MQSIPDKIHFIGIGGAGMSGLAQILVELGREVTGSDLNRTPVTERLESLGAVCYKGHHRENVQAPDLIVVSTAIPEDNPELVAAREKGIPVIHRGDLLSLLMERQKGIAICGAHGKTTTTSMLATVLEKNNLDPTIVIGGELTEIGGNAKLGCGDYMVAEADESDGSFLKLSPEVVVITNIEDDHLDYYGSISEIEASFKRFLDKVPSNGLAVVCVDDPNVCRAIEGYDKPVITYAVNSGDADYIAREINLNGIGTIGEIYFRGDRLGQLKLTVPGKHNLANALSAVAVGRHVGLSFTQIAEALRSFKGAGRRFQFLGEVGGVKVIDDYAHHPSEIEATVQAAKQVNPKRLIGVFQPHRYTRTSQLYDRFGRVFSGVDEIIINEIYSAGERPIEGVNAGLIVRAIKKNSGKDAHFFKTRDEIVDYLAGCVQPGDMVLTMGAGNIWTVGVELVERLKENRN